MYFQENKKRGCIARELRMSPDEVSVVVDKFKKEAVKISRDLEQLEGTFEGGEE
jgi:DNA-binding transcriptional regulator LsrR (DeoR family)